MGNTINLTYSHGLRYLLPIYYDIIYRLLFRSFFISFTFRRTYLHFYRVSAQFYSSRFIRSVADGIQSLALFYNVAVSRNEYSTTAFTFVIHPARGVGRRRPLALRPRRPSRPSPNDVCVTACRGRIKAFRAPSKFT